MICLSWDEKGALAILLMSNGIKEKCIQYLGHLGDPKFPFEAIGVVKGLYPIRLLGGCGLNSS